MLLSVLTHQSAHIWAL